MNDFFSSVIFSAFIEELEARIISIADNNQEAYFKQVIKVSKDEGINSLDKLVEIVRIIA